ncbi:MAG: hypothetical protein N3C13_05875, partial [Aquificaceae bacterium]|nr:hypothetical protein [Aquificaceae bacterium]
MKVPFSWLSEFIDLQDLDPYRVAQELTLKGVETSVSRWLLQAEGALSGKVVEKRRHFSRPLWVYRVHLGERFLQVVSSEGGLE